MPAGMLAGKLHRLPFEEIEQPGDRSPKGYRKDDHSWVKEIVDAGHAKAAPSFEAGWTIFTKSCGTCHLMADVGGKEVRIAAFDIEEATVSSLSPMASNMLDQIGEENLPDLLAYLMQPAATP